MHYLFALSWRVFDRIIESHDENHKVFMMKTVWSSYLHLSNILLNQIKLLSWIIKSSFSTWFKFLSSTSQLNSTLFQKNFNSTQHFLSWVLNLNSSTWLNVINLLSVCIINNILAACHCLLRMIDLIYVNLIFESIIFKSIIYWSVDY